MSARGTMAIALLAPLIAVGGTPTYEAVQSLGAGGMTRVTGGLYEVDVTVGQPAAGRMAGRGYEVIGGFLGAAGIDCDGDGMADDDQIAGDPALDCNNNGQLDSCELADCDGDPACGDCPPNGVLDACDIAQGLQKDCNLNGVPDECPGEDLSRCVDWVGGCDITDWSCTKNWMELQGGDAYPDNEFTGDYEVVLAEAGEVFLDVEVEVNALQLTGASRLVIVDAVGAEPFDMNVIDAGGLQCFAEIVNVNGALRVASTLRLGAGGSYGPLRGDGDSPAGLPRAQGASSQLAAGGLLMDPGPSNGPGGGSLQLDSGMSTNVAGNITALGVDPGDTGCTPPDICINIGSQLEVGGDLDLRGGVIVNAATANPITVGGDFINTGAQPELFNFDAEMRFAGLAPLGGVSAVHTFEVADPDFGQDGFQPLNYKIHKLSIAANNEVILRDLFDNDLRGQGLCTEALYVDHLELDAGATLTLEGCRIYSASEPVLGAGAIINHADCSGNNPEPLTSSCADLDGDGIRDDNCVWINSANGVCHGIEIPFGDMGGQFGACTPDGTADGNDRFLALNCFANTGAGGGPFACELSPPDAVNIDAGGLFGACCPDGVCDGNDAFAATNAFGGLTTCECPADGGQRFTCPPPGPAPAAPVPVVAEAELTLESHARGIRPGQVFDIDVIIAGPLADLRGYQLHVVISGGATGHLDLVDMAVAPRRDAVFAQHAPWRAFNLDTRQLVVGLDEPGIAVGERGYLATLTCRASRDASGTFEVGLLVDDRDPRQRTYLFPTMPGGKIGIVGVDGARVEIGGERGKRGLVRK